MPITLTKKNKAKRARRGVFTIDMSVKGQGTPPYPAKYGITLSPPSGSSFPSSSHVAITATPLGAYTAPATYTWYLEGVRKSGIGVASNTYDFGDLNGPRTASVAVDVITAGGTVRKTAVYDITDDNLTLEIFDSGTGAGTFTGDGTYEIGDIVNITATPDAESKFDGWVVNSGNTPDDIASADTNVTVSLNTSLDATFKQILPTSMTFSPEPNQTWPDQTDFSVTGSAVGGTPPFKYLWWSASVAVGTTPSMSYGVVTGPDTASLSVDVTSINASGTASFTWTGKVDAT